MLVILEKIVRKKRDLADKNRYISANLNDYHDYVREQIQYQIIVESN